MAANNADAAADAEGTPVQMQIRQLAGHYQREFQDQYQTVLRTLQDGSGELRQGLAMSRELLKQAERDPIKRATLGVVQPLKNMGSIGLSEMKIMPTFAWISVMMAGYWIAFNLLSILLSMALSLLFTDVQALALGSFLIPIFTFRMLSTDMDKKNRYNLLLFAIVEGVFMGHVFLNYHLHLPLPFVVPLSIAVCARLLSRNVRTSRVQFLTTSLLAGFALNCFLGWTMPMSDGLTFSFLLVALLQTLSALFILQFYIDHCEKDYVKNPYLYMFDYLCAHVCVQVLVLILFAA